ncbi:peptidyl-tRNA hydrolase [Clathrospora elynae]|uniref:peptidyl-tRNA hydrolase n=1 Tax=Clathrospora elynae TaxID=706981 RepID=A0A6A5T336_9PLEO|nr:peptidyl-tRNA hydrolase [Clathrospora elynae]
MSDAITRAHVASLAASLVPVADPASEFPQTSTPDDSDIDSDGPIEITPPLNRKQLRQKNRRQELKQHEPILPAADSRVEISRNPTPDDTDSADEGYESTPPKSKKEKRKQKKQKHNSALPTPTSTDTESAPPQSRKPPNNPPKSQSTPPTTTSSSLTTLPPQMPPSSALQTAYPLLICSIGNPGPTYANTLHSAGHILTTYLSTAKSYKPFTKGLSGSVSRPPDTHMAFSLLGFKRVTSDKPEMGDDWTFWQSGSLMNVSGNGVKRAYNEWLRSIRSAAGSATLEGRLVVVHDELESALGKVTVKDGAASAKGHNGLKSCQQQLGGVKWWRVGVGIGRPESRDPNVVSKYVLGKMTSFQRQQLERSGVSVYKALEDIAAGKK